MPVRILHIINSDDASDEEFLLKKTEEIIGSKLKSESLQDLVKDDEFKESIFQRFAALRLPLREGTSLLLTQHLTLLFCFVCGQKTFLLLRSLL